MTQFRSEIGKLHKIDLFVLFKSASICIFFYFPAHFFICISPFVLCRLIWCSGKETRPKSWKVIPVKDKLLSLHPLSLLEIIFSQLQNSPQWAVVHLTKLPTHNSTQFHAIVCLCSWKSSSELGWRLFFIASREVANFVGCLCSIRLLLNTEGLAFSLVLPTFRNLKVCSVESTKLVQMLKCLSRNLFILMQTQNQLSQLQ